MLELRKTTGVRRQLVCWALIVPVLSLLIAVGEIALRSSFVLTFPMPVTQ